MSQVWELAVHYANALSHDIHSLTGPVPNVSSWFGFIFSLSHFLSAVLSSHSSLSLSTQAVRKCQLGPGYFRPNWEIDVPPETWHLDMPFILSHTLPPQWQKPDMLTTHWNIHNCPFLRAFLNQSKVGMTREGTVHHWRETQSVGRSREVAARTNHCNLLWFHSTGPINEAIEVQ